ncbi:MAG TPA: DUF5615 family PIN-like protein [Candidatus Acidoferrales bacterium]|nr:DUF5615 family PIN-like protein [Candidatus Acidoferrales bacterium]
MKILIDMNLSPLWAQFLTEHGIEATHWSAIGDARAEDSTILNYASSNGFVVLTHDFDFGMLLAARKSQGPSVIQVRTQDVMPAVTGEVVLRAVKATAAFLEAGALVVVEPARHRIRLLPI